MTDDGARKPYWRQAWGGFLAGRLDKRAVDTGFGGWRGSLTNSLAVFTSKADARREYQDVRKVEIREVARSKRTRKARTHE